MLTKEELHELFEYKEGVLISKTDRGTNHRVKKGQTVGCKNSDGYLLVMVKNRRYTVHRLIYIMHHGFAPPILDHINGNRTDNRIENLRTASNTQNNYNIRKPKNNTSGVKGISWHKRSKKWYVQCGVNNKNEYLGMYNSIEEAEKIVRAFREKHHGKFCNHGMC